MSTNPTTNVVESAAVTTTVVDQQPAVLPDIQGMLATMFQTFESRMMDVIQTENYQVRKIINDVNERIAALESRPSAVTVDTSTVARDANTPPVTSTTGTTDIPVTVANTLPKDLDRIVLDSEINVRSNRIRPTDAAQRTPAVPRVLFNSLQSTPTPARFKAAHAQGASEPSVQLKPISVDFGKLPSFDRTKEDCRSFLKRLERHLTGLAVPVFQWTAILIAKLGTTEADWLEGVLNASNEDYTWEVKSRI